MNHRFLKIYFFVFVFAWPGLWTHLQSQTKHYSIQLAEAYEKDGQYDEAVQIYENLYQSDSLNPKIINGLKSGYKILGKQDQRIGLIRKQLQIDSTNILLIGEMIDACYKKKNIDQSRYYLAKALTGKNQTLENYQYIGRLLYELGWFEESLRIYQQARQFTKNDLLFILEIAGLQTYQEQYYNASKEYIKHYRINPGQWPFVKNQLLIFPDDSSANRQVIQALRDHIQNISNDMAVNRFLLEFYIRSKMYDRAFELAVDLDKSEQQNGISILNFSQAMVDQSQFTLAVNAYQYFLKLYPNAPQAEIGLASCYLAIADSIKQARNRSEPDSVSKNKEAKYIGQSFQLYQGIIKKYPNSDWAAESLFQSGMICLNRYHDYDQVLSFFNSIQERYSKSVWQPLATIQTIECLIRQNKVEQALPFCVNQKTLIKDPALKDQFLFLTAELYLYESQIDSSMKIFQQLSEKQQGYYVNDALQNLILIQQGKESSGDLKQFIKAKLLQRQFKHTEAIELLTSMSVKDSPLSDRIYFQIAMAQMELNKNQDALKWLFEINERFPDSPLLDLSLKTIGDIYTNLLDDEKAVSAYKQILIRYPKSIYINEARIKIRRLESRTKKAS